MTTADEVLRELAVPPDWLATELQRTHTERWVNASPLDSICEGAVWPAGKLLRPALLLESCAAVGGDPRDVLPAALSVEYFHAASLVHDDIIDGGMIRRGRPSVVARFGTELALLAGDELVFQVFQACAACVGPAVPASRVLTAVGVLAAAGAELCRGQQAERALRADLETGLDQYCAVAAQKTSALLTVSCQVGAILGGGTADHVAALSRFARCLGVAFQMADDMRPYLPGRPDHGKDVLTDIACRAMTFPLVVALREFGGEGRSVIAEAFSCATPPQVSFQLLADMVLSAEVIDAAAAIVDGWVSEAKAALEALPCGSSRDRLARIAATVGKACPPREADWLLEQQNERS
jgi:geranylgeranyl pyrophosphate synthase